VEVGALNGRVEIINVDHDGEGDEAPGGRTASGLAGDVLSRSD
jgi:hypothetical protein